MTTEQALCIAVAALVGAIGLLYRRLTTMEDMRAKRELELASERTKRDLELANERIEWAKERTRYEALEVALRAEYEGKHRLLIEQQQKVTQAIYDAQRTQENELRKEFTSAMEVVSGQFTASTDKISVVIDKMLDRLLGSRRHHGKAEG